MNLISGKGETSSRLPAFSLFLPGSCPNYRDRRNKPTPEIAPSRRSLGFHGLRSKNFGLKSGARATSDVCTA
jgi:hypothetical protein